MVEEHIKIALQNINNNKERKANNFLKQDRPKEGKIVSYQIFVPDEVDYIDKKLKQYRIPKGIQRTFMFINAKKDVDFLFGLTEDMKENNEIRKMAHVGMEFSPSKYQQKLCGKIFMSHYIPYDYFCKKIGSTVYKQLVLEQKDSMDIQKQFLNIDGLYESEHKYIESLINTLSKRVDICIV